MDFNTPEGNTVIHPLEENQETHETASTSSTASASHQLRQCPHCNKELQTRALFNHIYKFHPFQVLCSMGVYKNNEMDTYLVSGNAFPFEYTLKNDFDENEDHKIYGCLSCKHTFTVEDKANHHCQQKKCKANHIKGLKKMIKDEKESKYKPDPRRKTLADMKRIVELEMRRYKHVCVISKDLQDLYHMLKEKNDDQTMFDDEKIYPITEFSPIDYRVDTEAGMEGLEKQNRLWTRRNTLIEDKYIALRDYLYHYSSTIYIDRYKAMSYDCPDRIYVGYSNHDSLGPEKYPPL